MVDNTKVHVFAFCKEGTWSLVATSTGSKDKAGKYAYNKSDKSISLSYASIPLSEIVAECGSLDEFTSEVLTRLQPEWTDYTVGEHAA